MRSVAFLALLILHLQEMAPVGSTVTLKVQTTDRYGRTVAEVSTGNSRNVGLAMLQQGNAYAYLRYLGLRYLGQYDQWAYLDREPLAVRYRSGVWRVDGGRERPWDFGAARRAAPQAPPPLNGISSP